MDPARKKRLNTERKPLMHTSKKLGAAVTAAALAGSLAACGSGGPSGGGGKISDDKIVLGVISDMSGVYSDLAGKNSVEAVKMAVADFKKKYGDKAVTKDIEVISADHQDKPEVANTKAKEMYDREGADAIFDVPTSSAALAVANVAKQEKKLFFEVGAGTTSMTTDQCNAYTYDYGYDTYMLAHGTGTTVTQNGAKNWYIIYPDYAFGQDMNKQFTEAIGKAGGKVVKSDSTPFPNDNFSTFLTKAANLDPKPDVLGAMQAGGDLVNLAKQYNQFGLKDKGIDLAVGLMFDTDIASIGADSLKGTLFTTAWFWNMDDQSRKWADEFKERTGVRPTFDHAGNYSAATQYLEAVQRAGTDDADEVNKELADYEFDDFFARNATLRAGDHNLEHDAYLVKVKDPAKATEEADYTEMVKTIPADEAFMSVEDSGCSMG
jgi:branched-chain amino acid transport system substrate-binding protein